MVALLIYKCQPLQRIRPAKLHIGSRLFMSVTNLGLLFAGSPALLAVGLQLYAVFISEDDIIKPVIPMITLHISWQYALPLNVHPSAVLQQRMVRKSRL